MPLAAPNVCPKCGFSNQPGYQFCTNCGSPIAAGPMPAGAPPPMAPPMGPPGAPVPYGYYAAPLEYERRKQIDRTKTGILLLLIGTLIGWIPVVSFISWILLFVGAILVILGRKAFGAAHSRNVMLSLLLWIFGVVGIVVLTIVFVFSILGAFITPSVDAVVNAMNGYLIGVIVISAIAGLSSVLFTYALQEQVGKILLWVGYGASIGVTVVTFFLLRGFLDAAIASGVFDEIAFSAQQNSLALLNAIPSIAFAAADYLAWSRINRGEIPAAPTPPGMPGPAPVAPPGMPPPPPPIQPP